MIINYHGYKFYLPKIVQVAYFRNLQLEFFLTCSFRTCTTSQSTVVPNLRSIGQIDFELPPKNDFQ